MDIKVSFKGGGSFVNLRPKFSSNGESIFVCWNNTLFCYNTKTGKVVAEFKGVNDRIIGFEIYKDGYYEFLMACLRNGDIVIWKVETQFRIITKKTGKSKLLTMHLLPLRFENDVRVVVSFVKDNIVKFALIDINSGSSIDIKIKKPHVKENEFVIDVGRDYFCVAHKQKVYFVSTESNNISIHNMKRRATCVACHPEERAVLIGDSDGRVVLWQDIFSSSPSQAVYHWHTLPARCVAFSTAGSYFYSGGEESVLVRWQVDNATEKKFLPRLPSTIIHVAVSADNAYLAIATTDNGIRIVDSRFNTVSLIQHLVIGNHFDCGIVFDPRTKALVMNGSTGQVQFYNPQDMSLLYKLDIVDQNKITNERNCVFENTQVTKIAISKTGSWMATVEERKDDEYTPELRLKFWLFNNEKQNFELNTSIEFPHEKSISNIKFQPSNNEDDFHCVTVGQDSKYKIWQLMDIDSIYKKQKIWNCIGEGFYRNLPCRGLSFSIDGSLISVGFGPTVTTWLPDTCELKCSLTRPFQKDYIEQVEFGSGNLCHLLVAATSKDLCVWNLLTLSLVWMVPLDVSLLIADHITTNMCVITTDNRVFVFSPLQCSKPIFASDTLLKDQKKILTAAFIPSRYSSDIRLQWYQRSHIFFIDSDRELFCVGGEEEYVESSQEIEDVSKTLFSMMLSKSQADKTKLSNPVVHIYESDNRHKIIEKYLEAPVHTMVPIRLQCGPILQSLVQKNERLSKINM